MGVPKTTLWKIEAHTKAKHKILQRYLSAWFPILNTYNQRIVYIDGFSGPGQYEGGEPGSPIIALNAAIEHRWKLGGEIVFWFIDDRKDRMEHLKSVLAEMSIPAHFKVHPQLGRFDDLFGGMLDSIDSGGGNVAPIFAFIDPFGFSGIPFALVERLLKKKKCEAFITFMVDSINRFLNTPQEPIAEHIIETFGTDEAVAIARDPNNRIPRLRALYQSKLNEAARYVRYFEMHDRNDRIQYYLFFATQSSVGHVKMKDAMWHVDPDGEFRFSDATNPAQIVLFENDPTAKLTTLLHKEFQGKGPTPIIKVKQYVENETAYLRKHMNAALKWDEAHGNIIVESLKSDGKRRRANTYPDEVLISFS